jgi:hypothetical protein
MTYRNDLDAAHARIESLEREKRALERELVRARTSAPSVVAPSVPAPSVPAPSAGALPGIAPFVAASVVALPLNAAPLAMEPIRRAPVDLGDLLGAARIVIFLFIVLNALVLDLS